MLQKLKANKILVILLITMCIFLILNPTLCSKSCLNALSVWTLNILPVMFPFFIFSRLLVNLITIKPSFLDKTFSKIYNVPCGSFVIFLLSTLSGYPMGAKLICYMYDTKAIDQKDAKKMMSFCSVSGPMFMVATIGIGVLSSFKAGIIILISNIIASLINGLLFRKGKTSYKQNILKKTNENLLTNSVYDSIISILMVGGFIVFSFLIIDILEFLKIFNLFSSILPIKFQESFSAILKGLIEMTRGIIDLGKTNLTLKSKTVISSALIGFGGTSIFMQSLAFLSKLKFKFTDMLKQKCFQGILAGFIAFLLSFVVFC